LYSIRPTDGDGDFTFSRGSNLAATRVDVNGLIEKGRENLLVQSNNFSSTWTGISRTSGFEGYDGSNDGWKITKTAQSYTSIQQSVSLSGVFTFSIYAKADTLSRIDLRNATDASRAGFDLSTGSLVQTSGSIADTNIESLPNDWYRISATFTTAATQVQIYLGWANSTAGSVFIQDSQVEKGLVATDYIETGASTAQAGILEDLPRLDYSGGASCPSLLLEPQRTNINVYSEYFLHSQATYTNASGIANVEISPEGVQNAHKLLEDTANARHRFYVTGASAGAGNIVVSAFLKDGNRGYGALHLDTGTDGRYTIIVDLSNGTIVDTMTFGTPDVVSEGVEPYGNGWYRAYIVLNKTSTANVYPQIGLASSDSDANSSGMPSYQGDGTHYIYCYGLQLEAGSYPTSYIPTMGSAVTRSGDAASLTGVADLLGDGSGTLYVEAEYFEDNAHIALGDGTLDNIFPFRFRTSNFQNDMKVAGVSQGNLVKSSISINNKYKVAISYATDYRAMYFDGTFIDEDLSLNTFPDGTLTRIGFDRGDGLSNFYGRIYQVLVFPTALTNAELAALTA
jgi:hypothetical protein